MKKERKPFDYSSMPPEKAGQLKAIAKRIHEQLALKAEAKREMSRLRAEARVLRKKLASLERRKSK